MNLIVQQVKPAILMVLALALITGVAYPLAVTAIAQIVYPRQAEGSLIRDADGVVIGSELIGQEFTDPRYFHGRPSATVDPDAAEARPYHAANSGASNLGPTNQKLIDAVAERARAYREENGLAADAPVPADAVTTSGSGLDPDISPANAALQVGRVAAARGLSPEVVSVLVAEHTEGRTFRVLGEPRVNVLKLNLALDERFGR